MASSSGIAFGDTTVVKPRGTHKATIVWLHDFGRKDIDSARFVRKLNLPNIKWICPTAPIRPVTYWNGAPTTAWCDVAQVSQNMQDDLVPINLTAAFVTNLLENEPAHVMKGVGGIGVGAAQALYCATCSGCGGLPMDFLKVVVGINGWLPDLRNFEEHRVSGIVNANYTASLPILVINEGNDMVSYEFGYQCAYSLQLAGFPTTFTNEGDHHTIVRNWLTSNLQL